jgi:DNA-binding SARP family transcriptional activator/GAF domain-containing protein
MSLDIFPAFLMAVLACWLGLSLLVRTPHDPAARAFAWLCLHLTLYGLSIVLAALTQFDAVAVAANRLQVIETVLLPPVWLHFIIVIARFDRVPWLQRAAMLFFYAIGLAMAGYALFSQNMLVDDQHLIRFPGVLASLWALHRIVPLLLSLVLVGISYRQTGEDDLERRQRAIFALAVVVGVSGALWATLARESGVPLGPSHVLWDVGLALMAYTVLAYRLLLPERVAQRAFYRSLLGSVLTACYVGLLLLLDDLVRTVLHVEAPLVTTFALVTLIAIFGPLRDWAGAWLDRRFFHREFDYSRLLRTLSDDLFERGDLAGQLQAALTSICRTLAVRAGAVAVQQGTGLRVLAVYGVERPAEDAFRAAELPEATQTHYDDWQPWPVARLLVPLRRAEQPLGLLVLGPKRSGEPYRETERALLHSLGSYLTLAIKHARSQQAEELAMAALAEQSRQLQAEQQLLVTQAVEAARATALPRPPDAGADGLRIFALGPLRVERAGVPIDRWGGDKAGTHQAEALFAFLFDRRGRGVTKDEAEELIWPDLELEKADMAFHRTISALRRTLEPGLKRGHESRTISYRHERYWLDAATVAWCDADDFVAATEHGHTLMRQGEIEAARVSLAQALALYRGDYMDDCPFFGDSTYVEERRAELRDQRIDALIALGMLYERLGQAGEAATCYRRAIAVSPEGCPRAQEGLTRLQIGIA